MVRELPSSAHVSFCAIVVGVFPSGKVYHRQRYQNRCVPESFGESYLHVEGQAFMCVAESLHLPSYVPCHGGKREVLVLGEIVHSKIYGKSA